MSRIHRSLLVAAALLAMLLATGCGAVDDGSDSPSSAAGTSGTNAASTTACTDAPDVPFKSPLPAVPVGVDEPARGDFTIAYANALDAVEPLHVEGVAAKLETERLGGTFLTSDAKGQVDLQISQIQQFITRKVDGIVVSILDPGALAPVLKRAKAAGIPVIGVEVNLTSDDPGPDWTSQVWVGRDQLPYLQVQWASKKLPCGGGFTQMDYAIPAPSIVFMVAQQRIWGKRFGLDYLGVATNPTNDIAGGEKAMTQLLSKYRGMDGLIAYNDESAIGAAAAARAAGERDLPIVGGNGGSLGIGAVKKGTIDATVQLQFPDVGRDAVWALYDVLQDKDVPRTFQAGKPVLVTQDNVAEVGTWTTALKRRYGREE